MLAGYAPTSTRHPWKTTHTVSADIVTDSISSALDTNTPATGRGRRCTTSREVTLRCDVAGGIYRYPYLFKQAFAAGTDSVPLLLRSD